MKPTPTLDHRLAVSRDYDMVQGLISAGGGLALVLASVTGQAAMAAVGCGLAAAIGTTYYNRRYGTLKASNERTLVTVLIGLAAIILVVAAHAFDQYRPAPILVLPLVAAAVLAGASWLGLKHVGLTPWHWTSYGLLALTTFLPLVGVRPMKLDALVPLGLVMVVTGLVDHRRLVAAFGTGASA